MSQAQERWHPGEQEWERQGLGAGEHSLRGWHGAQRGKTRGNPRVLSKGGQDPLGWFAREEGELQGTT